MTMDGELSGFTGFLQQVLDLPKGVFVCRFTINGSDDVILPDSALVCRRARDHSVHHDPPKLWPVRFKHQPTGIGSKRIMKVSVGLQDHPIPRIIDNHLETAKDVASEVDSDIFHGEGPACVSR